MKKALLLILLIAGSAVQGEIRLTAPRPVATTNTFVVSFGCDFWEAPFLEVQASTNLVNWQTIQPTPASAANDPLRNYYFQSNAALTSIFFRVNPR